MKNWLFQRLPESKSQKTLERASGTTGRTVVCCTVHTLHTPLVGLDYKKAFAGGEERQFSLSPGARRLLLKGEEEEEEENVENKICCSAFSFIIG